jgi:hypothetical protein
MHTILLVNFHDFYLQTFHNIECICCCFPARQLLFYCRNLFYWLKFVVGDHLVQVECGFMDGAYLRWGTDWEAYC